MADWSAFYLAVCEQAGSILTGLDDESQQAIATAASTSDIFWSASMLDAFTDYAGEDLRVAVETALDIWRENVLEVFADLLGVEWKSVGVDPAAVDRLLEVARG